MLLVIVAVTRPPARTEEHLLGALLTALVIVGAWLAMRRGWRRRAQRQAITLPAPAPLTVAADGPVVATYLGTTLAGAWLERITAHGLGSRSAVAVHASADAIGLDRRAARSFSIPAADVRAVRQDVAHAAKVEPDARVVVVSWLLGGELLDTGLRLASANAAAALVDRLRPFVPLTPMEAAR